MVIDGNNDIYVSNYGYTTVSEFAAGSTKITATLAGLASPGTMILDSSGDLFVSSGQASVVEFTPGSTKPARRAHGRAGSEWAGDRFQRRSFRRQLGWRHGERVRTGQPNSHCHAHRARRTRTPDLRFQRQLVRYERGEQHRQQICPGRPRAQAPPLPAWQILRCRFLVPTATFT